MEPPAKRSALPLARPVALDAAFVSRPFRLGEAPPLRVARLAFFHAGNALLGLVGFGAVVAGISLGIALLPLCCFGIVVFRLLGASVDLLIDGDVALHNFVAPRDKHIRRPRLPHELPEWFDLMGVSPRVEVARARQPVLAALYFLVVKLPVAMLSASALAFAFAFPVTTFAVAAMRATFFANVFALVGFLLLSGFLLFLGTAFMTFTADISCAITRFVCSDEPPRRRAATDHAIPIAVVRAYGTSVDAPSAPEKEEDRIFV